MGQQGAGPVRDDGLGQGRGSRLMRRTLFLQQLLRGKECVTSWTGCGMGWGLMPRFLLVSSCWGWLSQRGPRGGAGVSLRA